jgi:hypothetical protein
MFETITLTTILLISFFFWQNKSLGLTAAIPVDPNNRVQFYCSECLTKLKGLLPQATVLELEAATLCFTPRGSQLRHRLTMQDGKVLLTQGDGAAKQLAFLGAEGGLEFEKLSDSAIMVAMVAKIPEASHRVSLRLEVQYA